MTIDNLFTSEHPIWDPIECLPRVSRDALQLDRLRGLVERVAEVPFYKRAFSAADITPGSIQSLDDLRRLPITTKADLRDAHPLGFLTVPRASLARIHGSSGTTGKPTFVAYTPADLILWSDLVARLLVAGGLRPEHTVHIAFGYGLFTGGFGLHQGIEQIGAAIVPAASGNTRRQIKLIQDLGSEVLVCTPSYALTIADTAREQGIDPRALPLKFAHLGGEPWTEDMRHAILSASPARPREGSIAGWIEVNRMKSKPETDGKMFHVEHIDPRPASRTMRSQVGDVPRGTS